MTPPPGASRLGTRFGPYELKSLIGVGGMGEVYRAYDTVKERTVAVKLLRTEIAADASFQERFRRESRVAARLQEPHVIPVHDFGEIDGVLYIDMRLVEGASVKELLRSGGPLTPERATAIVTQVAAALDAAVAANRKVVLMGRSMVRNMGIASQLGYLQVPEGIEPGWAYNPGAVSRLKQAEQLLEEKEKTSTVLAKPKRPQKSRRRDDHE